MKDAMAFGSFLSDVFPSEDRESSSSASSSLLEVDPSTTTCGGVEGNSSSSSNGSLPPTDIDDSYSVADAGLVAKDVCLGIVLAGCCLLTVSGNAMVLHAVRTERKLQTVRISIRSDLYAILIV